jgi:hypothetical protein
MSRIVPKAKPITSRAENTKCCTRLGQEGENPRGNLPEGDALIFSFSAGVANAYQEKLFTNIPVFAIGEGTASYL